MNTNQFRIIALRTGDDFQINEQSALKALKPNTIYPFYSCFSFPIDDGKNKEKIDAVKFNKEQDIDLYRLVKTMGIKRPSINISAIVGANGSGKSTLVELLLMAKYNLGVKLRIIKDLKRVETKNEYVEVDAPMLGGLNMEILVQRNGGLIKYIFKTGFCLKTDLITPDKSGNYAFKNDGKGIEQSDLADFFYSLVINYSHYAFNSYEVGDWVRLLFHKNDGYQTPAVINPMRTMGNFDINKEKWLLNDRLIMNLVQLIEKGSELNSHRNLGNDKIAKRIKFTLRDYEKEKDKIDEAIAYGSSKYDDERKLLDLNYTNLREFVNEDLANILKGLKIDKLENKPIEYQTAFNYLLRKVYRTCINYTAYQHHLYEKKLNWTQELVDQLLNDQSHIPVKFKRAYNFLKYYDSYWAEIFQYKEEIEISITTLAEKITKIQIENSLYSRLELIPPSIYNKDIILEENGKELSMNSLSSGEKQKIFSISSIAYHLIYLASVNENKESDYISYKHVNIVLDEIELYYHPDWQRKYINDLLAYLGRINPDYLKEIEGINLQFLTHSPFILSDIPVENVLYLDKEPETALQKGEIARSVPKKVKKQTFGANIHSMLRDSFFMKEGLIGEFAKQEIHRIIKLLNEKDDPEENTNEKSNIRKIIDRVGEPLLRDRLEELYMAKYWSSKKLVEDRDRINKILKSRE